MDELLLQKMLVFRKEIFHDADILLQCFQRGFELVLIREGLVFSKSVV